MSATNATVRPTPVMTDNVTPVQMLCGSHRSYSCRLADVVPPVIGLIRFEGTETNQMARASAVNDGTGDRNINDGWGRRGRT